MISSLSSLTLDLFSHRLSDNLLLCQSLSSESLEFPELTQSKSVLIYYFK